MSATATQGAILWAGIDGLKVGYYCHNANRLYEEIQIQRCVAPDAPERSKIVMGNSSRAYIIGKAAKGKYKYSIEHWGQTYMIRQTKPTNRDQSPHVMVESTPYAVAARGLKDTIQETEKVLEDHNCHPIGNVVSEVHITCDVQHQLVIGDIWKPATDADGNIIWEDGMHRMAPRFTTRVRYGRSFSADADPDEGKVIEHFRGRHYETFQFGKNNLVRIYDKTRELKMRPQKEWEKTLWKDPNAKHVTRVEFQLRREMLKELEINSLDDLAEKLPDIWAHLTQCWFKLDTPWWATVQGAFAKKMPAVRIKPHKDGSKKQTNSQLMGQLHRAMLLHKTEDPYEVVNIILTEHRDCHGRSFARAYVDKRNFWEAQDWKSEEDRFMESIDWDFMKIPDPAVSQASLDWDKKISGGDVIHIPPDSGTAAGGLAAPPAAAPPV